MTMVTRHARLAHLIRWMIASSLMVILVLASAGTAPGQESAQPGAPASSILEMTWPNGVELLAGREMDLDEGQYEWVVTERVATDRPGDAVEVNPGVLLAVSGPIHVLLNGDSLVQLQAGAAMPIDEGDEIVVVSASAYDEDYLVIELLTSEDAERVVTGPTVDLVGPVRVLGGNHALMLMNLPVAVTIDLTPDQVIEGAIRPAVSIAHIGNQIPESLSDAHNYDRWIVALFPLADAAPDATPTVAPPQPTAPPAPPTQAPPPPPPPTQPATPPATETPTEEPTPVPTVEPTAEPTEEPSPTTVPPTQVPPTVAPTLPPATEVPPTPDD